MERPLKDVAEFRKCRHSKFVKSVLERALEKDPEKRYPSACEFKADLQKAYDVYKRTSQET
jgi:hypothetical protein